MNLNPIHRRSVLKQLGLSTLSLPILSQTSSLFAEPEKKSAPKQRLIVMFSPNGTIPDQFWPDKTGEEFEHKTILKPLEPFHDKMLVLKNLHNKVRGDGDNHMRGMSCLLTGIELFPGNVMGEEILHPVGPKVFPLIVKSANTYSRRKTPAQDLGHYTLA